jgi:DNA-binding transcriptional ArsR family regulator
MNIVDLKINSTGEPIKLLSRPKLKDVNKALLDLIENAPSKTIFRLDMKQIGDANASGIDEIIAKPLKWMIEQYIENKVEKYLYLENLSPEDEYDHEYNIESTFNIEQLCILAKVDKSYSIIGYLGGTKSSLREILEFVYENKQVTARDLVDNLQKQLNTASTQLAKLFEKRLITREEVQMTEGGRQFVYKSLF